MWYVKFIFFIESIIISVELIQAEICWWFIICKLEVLELLLTADEMQLEELIKHDNGNMDYVELILFHRVHINIVQRDDPAILFKTGDYLPIDILTSVLELTI